MREARQGAHGTEGVDETRLGRIVGVDLGGTRVRAVLADGSGNFLARASKPTEATHGQNHVINNIVHTIQEVLKNTDHSQIVGLGMGAPGPLNPKTGVVYSPPNLPGWNNVPLSEILEDRLGIPVYLGNDASLAALGEYTFGAGKNYRYLVYITISTGIGGGIIEDGRMIDGAKGAAGEIGHMTIEAFGPRCNCGNYGCFEVLASGTGIRRRAIELLQSGQSSLMLELVHGQPEKVTAETVLQAAKKNDEAARELIRQTGIYLGVGITNALHLFNPEIIVIGGGVSQMGEMLTQPMLEEIERRAMPAFRENVPVVVTQLGDDIGLYGAVALVLQNYEEAEAHKLELLKKRLH
jgi:glucokinase